MVNFTAGPANGSTVSGFRVEALRADGTVAATVTVGPTATTATVTGLTNGTAYTFRVTAVTARSSRPTSRSTRPSRARRPTCRPR